MLQMPAASLATEQSRSNLQPEPVELHAFHANLLRGFCNDSGVPEVDVPCLNEPAEKLTASELCEVKRERDQAWKRAQSLEHSLEIERHTSRAVATEAVEAQEIWEARVAELMSELAESSRLHHKYHNFVGEHQEHRHAPCIHEKMLLAVCQGEELKRRSPPHCPYRSPSSECLQTRSFVSQGTIQGAPCHTRENAEVLERLLHITEELQGESAEKEASALQARVGDACSVSGGSVEP
ncbi:unnamed protein product [Symbiodinium natans]|uniref:Uncharacterized protein n=1 Tax=Symbiodinium natans TaxID=878477 RepID=A0A812GEP4_9DINO|nr:unnamed protein product [Symbiodinium natans]